MDEQVNGQPTSEVPVVTDRGYDGIEEEAVVLYKSQSKSLPVVINELMTAISKQVELLPDQIKVSTKDRLYETLLFDYVKSVPTPLEVIKYREGSDGKEYEYFDEHYTNSELDRLFPGWWEEEMSTRYDERAMAYITTGYLCIEYTLPSGQTRIRRIYAVGGARVYAKVSSVERGMPEPSQPEDRAIASLTRWKKLAGKQLGIGLDIYHQRITPPLQSAFEDRIRDWVYPYAEPFKDIAKKLTTGKGMRKLLKTLPTVEQTQRFLKNLRQVENYTTFPKDKFWETFTKTPQVNADNWLTVFEGVITKFLEKNLSQNEYK